MNPYNDDVLYDFPMPYNGIVPVTTVVPGGTAPAVDRRKHNQNMAAVLTTLEYYDES